MSGLVCSGAGLDNGGNPSITAVRPPTIQRMDSNLTSTLNSLDYWDYSVELECLSGGPDGNDKEVFFSVNHVTHKTFYQLKGIRFEYGYMMMMIHM